MPIKKEQKMMLTEIRKKKLREFAEFVSMDFQSPEGTDLKAIAASEEVPIILDHYKNGFDGMTVFDRDQFFIHINLDSVGHLETGRARYTLAHELAHVCIEEHRIGLASSQFEPHASTFAFNSHKNRVEEEADYFASCLLMPTEAFKKAAAGKKFSLDLIRFLSEKFGSSILATTIKFAEAGTHEIFVVFSQKNVAKWYVKSEDFPSWPFRFKVGGQIPPTTVAGEFYTKSDSKFTGVEPIEPNDWFYPKWEVNSQLNEQCFYSDSYGYVISFRWFE